MLSDPLVLVAALLWLGLLFGAAIWAERRPQLAGSVLADRVQPVAGGVLHLVDLLWHGDPGAALGLADPADLHRHHPALCVRFRLPAPPASNRARTEFDLAGRPGRHPAWQEFHPGGDDHLRGRARHHSVHRAAAEGGDDELRACCTANTAQVRAFAVAGQRALHRAGDGAVRDAVRHPPRFGQPSTTAAWCMAMARGIAAQAGRHAGARRFRLDRPGVAARSRAHRSCR